MAYTPPTLRKPVFKSLPRDSNFNAVQDQFGYIQTIDATGTPQNSPLTVNTQATLVVPSRAVSVTIISKTNPVQVSEDSTYTAYLELPAGVPYKFNCARLTNLYLQTGSSTVVSFAFNML